MKAIIDEISGNLGNYTAEQLRRGVIINIGGIDVWVTGNIVDGVFRLGSASAHIK